MYKIYINETLLCLGTLQECEILSASGGQLPVLRYSGKKKFLLNVIDMLEKTNRYNTLAIAANDLDKMWADFQSAFKRIEAAGGLVFNGDKVLMIFRRGYWDLPKGKIDKGESPPEAALREVEEETGLQELSLGPHLLDTWHTYKMEGKRILKTTHWFLMKTTQTKLALQHEEDIESAQWISPADFLSEPGQVYGNILDVLKQAQLHS